MAWQGAYNDCLLGWELLREGSNASLAHVQAAGAVKQQQQQQVAVELQQWHHKIKWFGRFCTADPHGQTYLSCKQRPQKAPREATTHLDGQ